LVCEELAKRMSGVSQQQQQQLQRLVSVSVWRVWWWRRRRWPQPVSLSSASKPYALSISLKHGAARV